MSKLNSEERNALPDSDFAYIDSKGGRHLPIEDKAHIKDAIARFAQTHFENMQDKKLAAQRVLKAADKEGIMVDPSDEVAVASQS